jgi:hypothetical protein
LKESDELLVMNEEQPDTASVSQSTTKVSVLPSGNNKKFTGSSPNNTFKRVYASL